VTTFGHHATSAMAAKTPSQFTAIIHHERSGLIVRNSFRSSTETSCRQSGIPAAAVPVGDPGAADSGVVVDAAGAVRLTAASRAVSESGPAVSVSTGRGDAAFMAVLRRRR